MSRTSLFLLLLLMQPGIAHASRISSSSNYLHKKPAVFQIKAVPSNNSSAIDYAISQADAAMRGNEAERALRILQHYAERNPDSEPLVIAQAKALDALNKTADSVDLLRKYLARIPNSIRARACLADLYFLQGQFRLSRQTFIESLKQTNTHTEHDADDSFVFYRLAQISAIDGDLDQSLHYLKDCLELYPSYFPAHLLTARIYAARNQLKEANASYAKCFDLDKANPAVLTELASILALQGKTLDAVERLLRAHKEEPASVDIVQMFITIYGVRQDWPNAQDYARAWLQLEPNNSLALFTHAWCTLMVGEYAEAVQTLHQALKIDPLNPNIHNLLAFCLYEQRKVDDAIQEFKLAERFSRAGAKQRSGFHATELAAEMNIALVFACRSRFEESREVIAKLLRERPTDPNVRAIQAYILALEGQTAAASKIASAVLSEKGNELIALAVVALSLCEIREGTSSAAIARLKKLVQHEPNSAFVHYQLANAYLAAGESEQSIKTVQQALQIAPSNLDAKAIMALALIQRKNYLGAIPLLKECVVRNPKDLSLRLALARAQVSAGDFESAGDSFEKIHRLFPSDVESLIALAQISLQKRQLGQSTQLLEEALTIEPLNASAHLLQARSMFADGKIANCLDALSFFETVKTARMNSGQLKPVIKDAFLLRARCQFILSQHNDAADTFGLLLDRGESLSVQDCLDYADALFRLGRRQIAKEVLGKLVSEQRTLTKRQVGALKKLLSKTS